jgi:hypothetical protein
MTGFENVWIFIWEKVWLENSLSLLAEVFPTLTEVLLTVIEVFPTLRFFLL